MHINGIGEVKGIGPMTRIYVNNEMMRVRNLDDQILLLIVPMLFTGHSLDSAIDDNQRLRKTLKKLNPKLSRKLVRKP